jgi:hypothetical protein
MSNQKLLFKVLLALPFLLLSSCKEIPDLAVDYYNHFDSGNQNFRNRNELSNKNRSGISDFPHTIGSRWIYRFATWDNGAINDTIIITYTIIGSIKLQGGTIQYLWLRTPQNHIDTVTVKGDTLSFQDASNNYLEGFPLWGKMTYVFPLVLGKKWNVGNNIDFIDTCTVTGIDSVYVPFGTFGKSYHLFERIDLAPIKYLWWFNDHQWYVPGIGIVKREMNWYTEIFHFFSWELMSYTKGEGANEMNIRRHGR